MNFVKIFCLVLCSAFFVIGCKKDNDDDGSTGNSGSGSINELSLDSDYQYSMDLDDMSHSAVIDNVNVWGSTSYELGQVGGFDSYVWGSEIGNDDLYLIIEKGTYLTANSVSDEDFRDYFSSGTHEYSNGGSDGIKIILEDSSGSYRTSLGDQSESTFEIVETMDESFAGVPYLKVFAEFSCKVYSSSDPSQFKTITNGQFVNSFSQY